ncbi:hypothetical protein M3Y94_01091600 [Aphelenchoides besseyi]|nr:hypothetical protein M3Y94_01091600 [Aphelenchoides besseyi]
MQSTSMVLIRICVKRNVQQQLFFVQPRLNLELCGTFFRSLQIISSSEFGTEIESDFCREMLPLWMLLEIVFKTRSHAGNRSRKVYYVDDSYLPFNEDGLFQFYLSHNDVYNPAALAQTCMPLFEHYMRVANLLHSMSIDQAECLAIIVMSVYRRSMSFRGPNEELKRMLNCLFHELNDYYTSSFRNVAVRIGQLTTCLTAIEESLTHIIQQLTIVRLNYKSQNDPGYICYSMKCFADENSTDRTIRSNENTISYIHSN